MIRWRMFSSQGISRVGSAGESYGLGDGFMCIKESTVEVEDCEGYHCEVCIQRFEAG